MLLRDANVQPYKLDIIENTIQSNEKPRSELFRSWNDAINNVNSINNSNIPTLQIGNIHNSNYITVYLKEQSNTDMMDLLNLYTKITKYKVHLSRSIMQID